MHVRTQDALKMHRIWRVFGRSLDALCTECKMLRSRSKVEKTKRSSSVCTLYTYSVPTAFIVCFECVPYGVNNQGLILEGGHPGLDPVHTQCIHAPSKLHTKLRTKTLAYRSSESKPHFQR